MFLTSVESHTPKHVNGGVYAPSKVRLSPHDIRAQKDAAWLATLEGEELAYQKAEELADQKAKADEREAYRKQQDRMTSLDRNVRASAMNAWPRSHFVQGKNGVWKKE